MSAGAPDPADAETMRALFNKYDQDGNGVMTSDELGQFIKNGKLMVSVFAFVLC